MSKTGIKANKKPVKKAKPLSITNSAKKKIIRKAEKTLKKKPLTEKQKEFCRAYVIDWNGSRAYKIAYPKSTDGTARTESCKLLTKPNIQEYTKLIQEDLEKLCGISKARVLNEHLKLAFSSIAHLHLTWIKRREFEELTEDQKACIAEIDTKIRTEYEFDPEDPKEKKPIEVEYIRIKLYDKQKSLESISKMQGYDAPAKIDLTNKGDKFEPIDYSKLDESVLRAIIAASKST